MLRAPYGEWEGQELPCHESMLERMNRKTTMWSSLLRSLFFEIVIAGSARPQAQSSKEI